MKKIIYLILTSLFLCSCGKTETKEVSFIHAIGVDETENGIKLSAVLEEHSKKEENKYLCVSFTAESFEQAFGKLMSEHEMCYSGTAQLCFFGETLSRRALYGTALFTCESPVFPSKSLAISVNSVTANTFLENIKTDDDIKKIKKLCENEQTNLAGFFSLCTSPDKTAKLCSLTYDDEIKSQDPVFYRNCAIVRSRSIAQT